jgi:hypothetical protein
MRINVDSDIRAVRTSNPRCTRAGQGRITDVPLTPAPAQTAYPRDVCADRARRGIFVPCIEFRTQAQFRPRDARPRHWFGCLARLNCKSARLPDNYHPT